MPKVSVILPCYNVEDTLARSLDSILAQTLTDFELLVVIDGSPDNSRLIAESYARRDGRIKVFEKPNGGLSDARNFGLDRANGDWIYFMDSDDWIEPDLLEDNITFVESHDIDFVVFGYIQDEENSRGQVTDSIQMAPRMNALKRGCETLEINDTEINLLGYAWNKLYRRSFLKQHGFRFIKGLSLVEDVLFNAPIYEVSDEIRFNQKCYYHYVIREQASLTKQFHEDLFEKQKMRLRALDQWLSAWRVHNRDEILSQVLMVAIRYCVHNLYSYSNQLSNLEKMRYVRQMYDDPMTRKWVKFYKADSLKSKFYHLMVKFKLQSLTCIGTQMMKR